MDQNRRARPLRALLACLAFVAACFLLRTALVAS